MKLYLDTTSNIKTIIKTDETVYEKTYQTPREQNVYTAFIEALEQAHFQVSDIESVDVNPGPGRFTSLRAGIAIANTLSFSLHIPINGNPPGTVIKPEYGQEPSITIKTENSKVKTS
jgi:tRNA A37 threonylcarbamoyladenosine modification protein TsaB